MTSWDMDTVGRVRRLYRRYRLTYTRVGWRPDERVWLYRLAG